VDTLYRRVRHFPVEQAEAQGRCRKYCHDSGYITEEDLVVRGKAGKRSVQSAIVNLLFEEAVLKPKSLGHFVLPTLI